MGELTFFVCVYCRLPFLILILSWTSSDLFQPCVVYIYVSLMHKYHRMMIISPFPTASTDNIIPFI
jgi:hypothetical protein